MRENGREIREDRRGGRGIGENRKGGERDSG